MAVLDNLIAEAGACSGTELGLAQLLKSLKQSEPTLKLQGGQNHGAALFAAAAQLDVTQHSLACLFFMEACSPVEEPRNYFQPAAHFLLRASAAQIRLAPEKFVSLAGKVRDAALNMNCPRSAILPLRTAVAALAPSTEHLTPIHAMMLQCCVAAKVFNAGAGLAEQEVFEVDPAVTCTTARDFLLYSYYCGLIHIGRKQYDAALERLQSALVAPTMVVNAITLSTYKKWLLLCLIRHGKVLTLPKYTATSLNRAIKTEMGAYVDLASRYTGKSTTPELPALVSKHQAEFLAEENMGLVKLVLESQTKRNVQRLTQTFLTLSLQDIAAAVGLPSAATAELVILRMIDAGEIFARIDSENSMVRFLEEPEEYASAAMLDRLDQCIQRSVALSERVAAAEHAVSVDKLYVTKLHAKERSARYEDPSELINEQLTMGGPSLFSL